MDPLNVIVFIGGYGQQENEPGPGISDIHVSIPVLSQKDLQDPVTIKVIPRELKLTVARNLGLKYDTLKWKRYL